MKKLSTVYKKRLADGLWVTLKESSDFKRRVLTIDCDEPIKDELFLGTLVTIVEEKVPDLIMNQDSESH